ncbi:MAG: XRE family transcriptional regulator [Prevotella sp.]|nr:XRE family transcriptional regulator [Prevotella sp.]
MHIGKRIKDVMGRKHMSAINMAHELGCERTNVYNIFVREDINTALLQKVSMVLNYDFFADLSKETFKKS